VHSRLLLINRILHSSFDGKIKEGLFGENKEFAENRKTLFGD